MTRRPRTTHCDVDATHWSRYLDGEFSSAKCRQCAVHLADCAECREKLRAVRTTVTRMQAASRQPLPASVKTAIRRRAKAIARG